MEEFDQKKEKNPMEVSSVYDKMAAGYLTPDRRSTTALFREIQRVPLREYLRIARDNIGWYSGMKYLVAGPGPQGNTGELFGLHKAVGPYLDENDPADITYLDVSPVVLDLARQHVAEQTRLLYGQNDAGAFVKGAAETLDAQVAHESQDVVFAALCDHLDQDAFFQSAMNVLKPGGALITSYPADGLNRVVREKIYKIDPQHTRFTIEGEAHLVPSRLMTADSLRQLYAAHGYQKIQATEVASNSEEISETIRKAAALANVNPATAPLIVVGIGFKGT